MSCDVGNCDTCEPCAIAGPCSAQVAACDAFPECGFFDACSAGCFDSLCVLECEDAYPTGANYWYAAGDCILCQACAATCANECQNL